MKELKKANRLYLSYSRKNNEVLLKIIDRDSKNIEFVFDNLTDAIDFLVENPLGYDFNFRTRKRKLKCCICGNYIESKFGNNPYPIKETGQCCNACNEFLVIPARIKAILASKKEEL